MSKKTTNQGSGESQVERPWLAMAANAHSPDYVKELLEKGRSRSARSLPWRRPTKVLSAIPWRHPLLRGAVGYYVDKGLYRIQ